MKDSQEILIQSLEKSGVSIPEGVTSVRDLTPEMLVSLCSQSLNLIENTTSFSSDLPDSMTDRFRFCTDIAFAVKNLGYIGDMTYYKFLYPSEEDLYKLIRFLVERLSKSPEGIKVTEVKDVNSRWKIREDDSRNIADDKTKKNDNEEVVLNLHKVEEVLKNLTLTSEISELPKSEVGNTSMDEPLNLNLNFLSQNSEVTPGGLLSGKGSVEEDLGESETSAYVNAETSTRGDAHVSLSGMTFTSQESPSIEVRHAIIKLRNQQKMLQEQVTSAALELCHLEEELELFKEAEKMVFDDRYPIEFYLQQLNENLDARRHNLMQLESQWDALRGPLEEKKRSIEEFLYGGKPEAQKKLLKLKEARLEKKAIVSEYRKRDEEESELYECLQKQPKVASRRSYIERVIEITKNSRKLDTDVERILRETRDVQLESNSIHERLDRTYAVVDEMVLREAKKDNVGRQAYKLLTSIHESFEQISGKILMTDRVRRESGEYEKKLATMTSRSLNVDKLQVDFDSIRRENECLEKKF